MQPDPRDVDRGVREIAADLWANVDDLVQDMTTLVMSRHPQIEALGMRDFVAGSGAVNLPILLDGLARNREPSSFDLSVEVADQTLHIVRSGAPLELVSAGYRIVASWVVELWTDTAALRTDLSESTKIAVIRRGTGFILSWTESLVEGIGGVYRTELARIAEERSREHIEFVQSVLDGTVGDAGLIEKRLGMALAGPHLCLILRSNSNDDRASDLKNALYRLTSSAGVATEVTVVADQRTVWCWVRYQEGRQFDWSTPMSGVTLAVGRAAAGLPGFVSSHRFATAALRVAGLRSEPPVRVRYDDVEMVALCTADPDTARAFMTTVLGPLAASGAARQRETLDAFLQSSMNFRGTASRLGLHHNTVRYRLDAAEKVLGYAIESRRLELELALRLHAWLA
ncbi:MAG: helix-turn-helix domain-containing protein [Rhodococcus sp. (in: high G+C Gram-positive bacteria)]|uniref:PucR family transcriptional regulator n=1 Tax=Rhodococcus sp. EPR-157 TaxID=1813677 RepID=UPI0018D413F8|nr:helix-turn-helix domain-containing protein [Rhodococcus sp. EPR-157]